MDQDWLFAREKKATTTMKKLSRCLVVLLLMNLKHVFRWKFSEQVMSQVGLAAMLLVFVLCDSLYLVLPTVSEELNSNSSFLHSKMWILSNMLSIWLVWLALLFCLKCIWYTCTDSEAVWWLWAQLCCFVFGK